MTSDLLELPSLESDPAFDQLRETIVARTGLAYYNNYRADLSRIVRSRLEELSLPDCDAYLNRLDGDFGGDGELAELSRLLTVGETHFFRHREVFDAVREFVLPEIVARNCHRRRIHVWSAGCSIGAEAYSMAIALHEFLGPQAEEWSIRIVGTDINRGFLEQAQSGLFNDWALRSLSAAERRRYFEPDGGQWRIASAYRDAVEFQRHNLVADPIPDPERKLRDCDIILCRNVMIYFSPEASHHLINRFHGALANGGWLIVGHAETHPNLYDKFRVLNSRGIHFFQKQPAGVPLSATGRAAAMPCRASGSESGARGASEKMRTMRRRARLTKPVTPGEVSPPRPEASPLEQTLALIYRYADSGRLEEAHVACAALSESHPQHAPVAIHMGLLLEQMGNLTAATAWLRRALYLEPQNALARYLLGQIELRSNDVSAAQRHFGNVLKLLSDQESGQMIDGPLGLTVQDLRHLVELHLTRLRARCP